MPSGEAAGKSRGEAAEAGEFVVGNAGIREHAEQPVALAEEQRTRRADQRRQRRALMGDGDIVDVARPGAGQQGLHRDGGALPHGAADGDRDDIGIGKDPDLPRGKEGADGGRRREKPHGIGKDNQIEPVR